MSLERHAGTLEELYDRYNRRELAHPDPVEFLYAYDDPADREVAGLIASALAYGRVGHILRSVRTVLDRLGPHPAAFLRRAAPKALPERFAGFRHRFADEGHLLALLGAAGHVMRKRGSLRACCAAAAGGAQDAVPILACLFRELNASAGGRCGHLLPDPAAGSACKRLNLLLRWMVRRDAIDPGGWDEVSPALLIVPLDTHMHRIGMALGLTRRRQADLRTALEITEAFRRIRPDDPVRYDFALAHLGMRGRDARFLRALGLEGAYTSSSD